VRDPWASYDFPHRVERTIFAARRCLEFGLAGAIAAMGTLGRPIALTAIAFGIGLLLTGHLLARQ
jgi:hypothetical protein